MKTATILMLGLSLLAPPAPSAQAGKRDLKLEEVLRPSSIIGPGISNVQWRPGGHQVTFIRPASSPYGSGPTLCSYDAESNAENVVFPTANGTGGLDLSSYQWSPRGDAILLEGANEFWLLDPHTGLARQITHDGEVKEVPEFSPAGDRIAFVKDHDLYYVDVKSGVVEQLTHDGSETIYNGRLDWVYEEELADRSTARSYEWSPDGKQIAYVHLDDGPVPVYPITNFIATHVSLLREHFPQAGDPNPIPSVRLATVNSGSYSIFGLSLDRSRAEYVGPTLTWTPDGAAVCFLTINRAQTEVALHRWTLSSGNQPGNDRVLLTEHDPYWVNSVDLPHFVKSGREFLWISERDGWHHIYLYSADGKLLRQVTRGEWMLDRPIFQDSPLVQVDPEGNWAYFQSTHPDPRERQIYRIHLDGSGMERLTKESGYHTVSLSPDGRYFVDAFSTPTSPQTNRLLKSDGTLAAALETRSNHLTDYALGQREYLEVKAPDGAPLYAQLLKPPGFDPKRKYPVIVDVYGGPHVQLVQKRWDGGNLYEQLLAENGFLVWTLDNRGSWGRGHAWESTIFENMGQHELQDQLTGVEYLKSLPYVDASRMGIRGWSYGGYMTLYALTHAPDVFKCGAAGAPVTDWKFYDSIYTERYMRTPSENPSGYRSSSPLEAAANLKGKLLILHGTSDDNVHLQNTINFLEALIDAQKPYELHLQPGQKHGFQGEAPLTYRDAKILEFFKESLAPEGSHNQE